MTNMDEYDEPDGYAEPERLDELASPQPQPPSLQEIRDHLPGIARIAASTWLHTAEWSLTSSAKAARRLAEAAVDSDKAADLASDVGQAAGVMADLARAVSLGVPIREAVINTAASWGEPAEPETKPVPHQQVAPMHTLRERGEELLQRSRDVWNTDVAHPAYARILDDLAPDEARVLVLLLKGGPQPSVDVRTGGPIGVVNSQLIAPGLTMIGARAGCRYLDQVPAYLNNLFRLGLVWFSRESLKDPLQYQVVEAQPDVLDAMHSVKFAKVVRRSIHLTPFGEDFSRTCFQSEVPPQVPLPVHDIPPEDPERGGDPPPPGDN